MLSHVSRKQRVGCLVTGKKKYYRGGKAKRRDFFWPTTTWKRPWKDHEQSGSHMTGCEGVCVCISVCFIVCVSVSLSFCVCQCVCASRCVHQCVCIRAACVRTHLYVHQCECVSACTSISVSQCLCVWRMCVCVSQSLSLPVSTATQTKSFQMKKDHQRFQNVLGAQKWQRCGHGCKFSVLLSDWTQRCGANMHNPANMSLCFDAFRCGKQGSVRPPEPSTCMPTSTSWGRTLTSSRCRSAAGRSLPLLFPVCCFLLSQMLTAANCLLSGWLSPWYLSAWSTSLRYTQPLPVFCLAQHATQVWSGSEEFF